MTRLTKHFTIYSSDFAETGYVFPIGGPDQMRAFLRHRFKHWGLDFPQNELCVLAEALWDGFPVVVPSHGLVIVQGAYSFFELHTD